MKKKFSELTPKQKQQVIEHAIRLEVRKQLKEEDVPRFRDDRDMYSNETGEFTIRTVGTKVVAYHYNKLLFTLDLQETIDLTDALADFLG